jgi:ABC-type transport system substrate-binding protein
MNPNERKQIYTVRYTLKREQITEFLEQLYEIQNEYIEAAVEASKFKDANEVINHIKSL